MSITASWLILAVVLTRLILKKAPKWIPCLLWGLVAIRLVCPFSFGSIFSLVPSSETIPANITVQQEPAINSGITVVNEFINPVIAESFTPAPTDSVNPLQVIIPVAAIVWISGIVIMLAYALISYIRLKKTVSVCVPVSKRILSCDEVKAPFILGAFKPVIYVPSSMTGETLDLVIRHETAHLQRHDHWWKPLGFLLLAVYWFNPLCWIAYILLCRDIEMACDEKVIRDMDKDDMAAYSQALLDCSFPRKRIAACPLAFGEVGVKERVKGVLNYKKPAFWSIVVAVAACIVIAICFLTSPITAMEELRAKYPEYFDLSTFKGLELYVWQMTPDSYSCGLMLGTNQNKTLEELMDLKGASIAEMRAILSTYDIDEKHVIIIPWQNPVSSYIGEYWISREDEDPAVESRRKQEYIEGIREMLFAKEP